MNAFIVAPKQLRAHVGEIESYEEAWNEGFSDAMAAEIPANGDAMATIVGAYRESRGTFLEIAGAVMKELDYAERSIAFAAVNYSSSEQEVSEGLKRLSRRLDSARAPVHGDLSNSKDLQRLLLGE